MGDLQKSELITSEAKKSKSWLWIIAGVVWLVTVAMGLHVMLNYSAAAGEPGQPPAVWPAQSKIPRTPGLATIVVLGHPKCPCTRATISELALAMARLHDRATAVVVLAHPHGTPEHWEETDLWHSASQIPGVIVMGDPDEVETDRFHAQVSGQTMLYSANGDLLFSGGITASRGHSGDNAGRSSIVSLVLTGTSETKATPVYGCAMHEPKSSSKSGERH